MKRCKTCRYWSKGHDGVYDSDKYGNCKALNTDMNSIIPLCEGCVNVRSRVTDFEFVTAENFGCVKHTV